MEADWECEIGPGAPVIDAAWAGLVDLRREPQRVGEIAEVAQLPALAAAVLRLNGAGSPVWTSKCDVWAIDSGADEIDPDEYDAERGSCLAGNACYVDVLPRADGEWPQPEIAEAFCRRVCARLRSISLRQCRADLVMRQAVRVTERFDVGITAYVGACGRTPEAAREMLGRAVAAVVDAMLGESGPKENVQSYNESNTGE